MTEHIDAKGPYSPNENNAVVQNPPEPSSADVSNAVSQEFAVASSSEWRQRNIASLERRLEVGLALLEEHYQLEPVEVDPVMVRMEIGGRPHEVAQYNIKGVGNLLLMTVKDSDQAQLGSFVLTPYEKNLPLLSSDYVFTGEKRFFLIEVYALAAYQDDAWQRTIQRFADIRDSYSEWTDMPTRPCWYDEIRPVLLSKVYGPDRDEQAIQIFLEALEAFIAAEQDVPDFPNDTARQAKWQANSDYADALIDQGGVSTQLFTAAIGTENTRRFFREVFFAPDAYRTA